MESKYGRDWDVYFLNIARVVGRHSKCRSRQIGTVLVKDKNIIATGYNGPPKGIPPCETRINLYIDKPGGSCFYTIDGEITDALYDRYKTTIICPRHALGCKSGERLDICVAAHAEENAVNQAAKMGISTRGSTIYCLCGPPCTRCMTTIINSGIETIVCLDTPFYDFSSEYLVKKSGIEMVNYNLKEIEEIGSDRYGVEQISKERVY
jgi:dCMP deaminase